jgi:hypothetical protein
MSEKERIEQLEMQVRALAQVVMRFMAGWDAMSIAQDPETNGVLPAAGLLEVGPDGYVRVTEPPLD